MYLFKKYHHSHKICQCIRKGQVRIVLGILLAEENKIRKYFMWRKGCCDTDFLTDCKKYKYWEEDNV